MNAVNKWSTLLPLQKILHKQIFTELNNKTKHILPKLMMIFVSLFGLVGVFLTLLFSSPALQPETKHFPCSTYLHTILVIITCLTSLAGYNGAFVQYFHTNTFNTVCCLMRLFYMWTEPLHCSYHLSSSTMWSEWKCRILQFAKCTITSVHYLS